MREIIYQFILKLSIVFVCSSLLVGCGGGGSGADAAGSNNSSPMMPGPSGPGGDQNQGWLKLTAGDETTSVSESPSQIMAKTGMGNENDDKNPGHQKHPLGFESILIPIAKSTICIEDTGCVVLNSNPVTFDLMKLDAAAILADNRIPPGHYRQIRLYLSDQLFPFCSTEGTLQAQ